MDLKLVCFDCDGVLTDDGWRKLDRLLISDTVHGKWKKEFDSGRISLQDWAEKLKNIYRNIALHRDTVEKLYESGERINPDAAKIFDYLRSKGIKTAIISAGLAIYVEKIAAMLKADFFRANTSIKYDKNGFFTGFEAVYENGAFAKVKSVHEIAEEVGTSVGNVIFVGDSLVDIEAFKATKHGVLYQMPEFEAHIEELERCAWKKIVHLSELVNIIENE